MTDLRRSSQQSGGSQAPFPSASNASTTPQNVDTRTRKIWINETQKEKFINNQISTAKYSVVSFLPYFLREQFRRYSNLFFLAIGALQQIPDVSPTGKFTTLVPLICILTVSAIKEIIEDYKRHQADREINNREVEVLKNGRLESIKWREISVGDFVRITNEMFFPADLVLYSSSESEGICYIETSNLDGETNLKVRQGLKETSKFLEIEDFNRLKGYIECELPNRHLYDFAGKLKLGNEQELALGPDQVLLRGSKLQNTSWILGQVIYTGQETKLMKNSTAAPLKRSTVDKLINVQILMLFCILIFVAVGSAALSRILVDEEKLWYVPQLAENAKAGFGRKVSTFLYSILTFVILYNNLIPISLTVTLEVVRFIQAMFINWDNDMYDNESDTPAQARTSNLNEELGLISYVFSDKTGTLTRNVMEFKGCTVAGELYGPDKLFHGRNELIYNLNHGVNSQDIRSFLTLLSVCHTVIPDYSNGDEVVYHAASPDERALVNGAKELGFKFQTRTPSYVEIDALGEKERYEILNVLEFTSGRKRMSVIVKAPDGKIMLYCKGADSVIYERLQINAKQSSETMKSITQEHLDEYATVGLRTLCCAMKEISPETYQQWQVKFHAASTAIHHREFKLEEAAELIETNLLLLGATAIEDKLQDKVPETIASLMKAGISVWVLTGDKQETAINIGYSCRLLNQSMEILKINQDGLDETRECIRNYISALSLDNYKPTSEKRNAAIVIDGNTLKYALGTELQKDFLRLCCSCRAVICCRASPMQKAEIVECVTQETGAVTLAIGDGANDVAMIQKAHVGVGITGQEGLQAACASDYAIAQFRFLTKLLFVHGAWNYDRISKLIFYSYYKNICLYIIELWFAIYSAWSGQIIFERWTIGLYNMLFTCAQPIAMGIFERNVSEDIRLRYPILYKSNQNCFNMMEFGVWIGNSLLHSVLLYWVTLGYYGDGVLWHHGMEGGYLVLGNFIYTYVVVVVSIKSGLETKSWTIFTHLAIWGSIVLWLVCLWVYSYIYAVLPIGAEICGIGGMVYSTPVFWIGLLVVPVTTLMPDFIYKAIRGSCHISLDEKYRQYDARRQNSRHMYDDSDDESFSSALSDSEESVAILVAQTLEKKGIIFDILPDWCVKNKIPGTSTIPRSTQSAPHISVESQVSGLAITEINSVEVINIRMDSSKDILGTF